MTPIHATAQQGFSSAAEAYARGRPEYPAELAGWLSREIGISAASRVADLGAGTGKFTRLLAATGAEVIAIEPVAEMRAQLSQALPKVCAIGGSATATTLEAGLVDAVVCAQAFHWFANDAALAEIHRVLKPGGRLGLIWNVRDDSAEWVNQITRIITPYEGDVPRFHNQEWRKPFAHTELFDSLEETAFVHRQVGPPQQVIVDRFLSVSFIAALPADERARVEAKLKALVASDPALRGRETIEFPYRTLAFRTVRRD